MQVKYLLKQKIDEKGQTIVSLNQLLNSKHQTNKTSQNLTQKINKETITYKEVLEIAEVLGYEICWRNKEANTYDK